MSRLRLKIDLSEFFVDKRRLAYVMTNKKWGHVADLEEHVENMFEVSKVHFTTDDGIFLPSRESIEVLSDCNFLKAFMEQELREKRPIEREPGDQENADAKPGDKRKLNGNGSISSSTPNGPNKKKRRTSMDTTVKAFKMSPDFEKSNCSLVPVTSTNSSPKSDKSSPDLSQSVDIREESVVTREESMDTREETVKTRKRKRLRKKGQFNSQDSETSTRLSCVPVPISSSTLRLSKTMSTPNGKHVRFDEDVTLVQENVETVRRNVIFRCRLSDDDSMQPRAIEAELEKPQILIQENILLVEGKDSSGSDDCENSSVIEIEDSFLKATDEQTKSADPDLSVATATVDQILPVSEPLVGLPKAGDVIIFKMFRLSAENTNDMTEFICARCEEVDSEKKKIKCTILDGLDQIEDASQKCLQGSDESNPGASNCFEYFLDELMDARISRTT